MAAHPDDETLGCGGTIARLAKGNCVNVLILGEGATARYATRADAPSEELSNLAKAAMRAALTLGVSWLKLGDLPDNRFDSVELLSIVKRIEGWLVEMQPEVLYTHSAADLNVDHRITAQAVLMATRPQSNQTVREVYAFEVPSATDWAFGQLGTFRPNVFVDIADTIETKLAALACYESEVRLFPHPRSFEAIRASAQRWGSMAGVEYAEAFELIRRVDGR